MLDLLKDNVLENTVFSRTLSSVERMIINNRYVAALFYNNRRDSRQIRNFADEYDITLDRRFDYRYNVIKTNKELNGYTAFDVVDAENRLEIYKRLEQARHSILYAIEVNDIEELKKWFGFAVNMNQPNADGSLPFERAIQVSNWEIVRILILKFGCSPAQINTNGQSTITIACRLEKIDIIRGLLVMDEGFVDDFLDITNLNYNYANDALRIIIDMDKPKLLDDLFASLKSKKLFDKQLGKFNKMLDYAVANNKHLTAKYLQFKLAKMLELEQNFMLAIISGNMSTVANHILQMVDINKEINGKYPLEQACISQHWDVVFLLLKSEDIIYSQLYDSNVKNYNVRLDVAKYILDNDQIFPFLTLLRVEIEGRLRNSYSALELMKQYAEQNSSIIIAQFIHELIDTSNEKLFKAAMDGNCQEITAALTNHANINASVGGKNIIHVVCEFGRVEALRLLLVKPNIDVNCSDADGNYPITYACKQDNYRILELLLDEQIVRRCDFQSAGPNYVRQLDVLKNIIDADNAFFLEPVLRRHGSSGELIYIDRSNMLILHNYASTHNKTLSIRQLATFVDRLTINPVLFERNDQLRELGDHAQGISRVDLSFGISLMRLCERYNATIESIRGRKYSRLRLHNNNILELLSSLDSMISIAKANGYKIYESNPSASTNPNAPKYIAKEVSDLQYQSWARDTYNRLVSSIDNDSGMTWHSAWFNDTSKELVTQSGINMGEVWCLAILAAQDQHAVVGLEYSAQDIKDREQLLVAALVESQRAYSYDLENYLDTEERSDPKSCEHGVAVRAFLALCGGLHDDIHIHENPLEWAHNVAKDALQHLFNNAANKDELNDLILKHKFQRSYTENCIVADFYVTAVNVVKDELVSVVGMTDNYGYLKPQDLKVILDNIEEIELPLTKLSIAQLELAIAKTKDFDKVECEDLISQNNLVVSQYKLPLSSDSVFAALIISAKVNNIDLTPKITVHMLRHMVAHIISCVINDVTALQNNLEIVFRGCNVNPKQSSIVIASIKQLIKNSLILESDPKAVQYLKALRLYAQPDNLVLSLISALFGAKIVCYDFTGTVIAQYSSSQLFLQPKNAGCIEYSCKVVQEGTRLAQDRSICCAIVNNEKWTAVRGFILSLQATNTAGRLVKDNQCCENYSIMLSRNIAGFEQIKMPMREDNLVLSVFIAARCANTPNQYSFDILKQTIQSNEIVQHLNLDGDKLDLLARLYDVRITVYDLTMSQPQCYGSGVIELRLHKANEHYNLLVQPRNWFGFDERLLGDAQLGQEQSVAAGSVTSETSTTESLGASTSEPNSKRVCYTMQ